MGQPVVSVGSAMRHAVVRLAGLGALWWGWTEGDRGSWIVGIPLILTATMASCLLIPATGRPWRVTSLISFGLFFLWESLRGGADVAWRVLQPQMPLQPQFYEYPLRLPAGGARVVFMGVMSLLPGTLGARLHDDQRYVTIHLLVCSPAALRILYRLEERIAGVLGVELLPAESPRLPTPRA